MTWFVTPRVRFLHVPKTGGTFLTEAIAAAGVPIETPEGSPGHASLAESLDYSDRFTFAVIRHPLDYWRSYWAFRLRTGWDMDHELDRDFATDNFEEFIEAVIAHVPGAASHLYEQFVGPPEDEIDFVGRYENLVDDVCRALRLAGESFDEQVLRSYPKVNVSDYGVRGGLYPQSLATRLAESERGAIERFYPWDPTPARLVIGAVASPNTQRIADLTVQLRNARADLTQAQSTLVNTRLALEQAQRSLEVVQNSALQRRTRRLRSAWYQHRGLIPPLLKPGERALRADSSASGQVSADPGGRRPTWA
jgi:hypothetical protein